MPHKSAIQDKVRQLSRVLQKQSSVWIVVLCNEPFPNRRTVMTTVAGVTNGTKTSDDATVASVPFVKVDEERIEQHLDDVVRRTVEQTLNALLDAEAYELCGAKCYERSANRRDTRAGH
jgi:Transposase, Mutator family